MILYDNDKSVRLVVVFGYDKYLGRENGSRVLSHRQHEIIDLTQGKDQVNDELNDKWITEMAHVIVYMG